MFTLAHKFYHSSYVLTSTCTVSRPEGRMQNSSICAQATLRELASAREASPLQHVGVHTARAGRGDKGNTGHVDESRSYNDTK
jgi:hypothetical protein